MSKVTDIVSTAFNFEGYFNTGVDVRTGGYRLGITVGNLLGAGGQHLKLMLGYNYLSTRNIGFGDGWSLSLARYDILNKRLVLADGSSYRFLSILKEGDVTDQLQYLKTKNIKVIYINKKLTVQYKDGTQEQFDTEGNLKYLIAPSGHQLTFSYAFTKLISIKDQSGKELKITYADGETSVQDGMGKHVRLLFSGAGAGLKQLIRVILPTDVTTTISYRYIDNLYMIDAVTHPSGATEQILYTPRSILLPAGGPIGLPAVSKHVTSGVNLTSIIRSYTYSKNNFLGAGLSKYTSMVDNLCETTNDYTYTSSEAIGTIETTKTYNKFHLLINESLIDTATRALIKNDSITYYATPKDTIHKQPEQYLLPRQTITTYANTGGASRRVIIDSEYDIYGNIISHTDAYGIKTESTYYPGTGEPGLAPAAACGYPYLIKQKRVSPSLRNRTGSEIGQKKTFTYKSLPRLTTGFYSAVASETIDSVSGNQLSHTEMEYLTDNQPQTHGLLRQKVTIEATTRQTETYQYQATALTLITTRDSNVTGLPTARIKTESCLYTGLDLGQVDELGRTTNKTYDALNRVTQEVFRAGSPYEIRNQYEYSIGTKKNTILIKCSDGTQQRTEYDDLRREQAHLITDTSGALVLVQTKGYNSLGQVNTVTRYEEAGSDVSPATTSFKYDNWGDVSEEARPSGVNRIVTQDKALNTTTEYLLVNGMTTGKVTHYFNEQDQPTRSLHMEYETSNEYDGLGRLVKKINPWGIELNYELDELGRCYAEHFNDSTTTKKFDPQSNSEHVTQLSVQGIETGTRQFDPMGRIVSETKYGYTTQYIYNTLSLKPNTVIQPDGQRIEYTLDLNLDEVTHYTTTGDKGFYTFDAPSGRLLETRNADFTLSRTYYINGALKSQSQSGKTAEYRYSRLGALLLCTDYFGRSETRHYNAYGRLDRVNNTDSIVELSYDGFDRLKQETIISQRQPTLKHTYVYDRQNRLTEKLTTVDQVHYLAQHYTYLKDGKLSQKKLTDEQYSVTTETYTYDDYSRLIKFTASGSQAPRYLDDGAISEQTFAFDALGNIAHVTTLLLNDTGPQFDTADYHYDANNALLLSITYSLTKKPNVLLTYNANGQLANDEQGRQYHYTPQSQLDSITDASGVLLSRYKYSAEGTQLKQSMHNQPDIQLFYGPEGLMNEAQENSYTSLLSVNGRTLNRVVAHQAQRFTTGLVGDYKNTTLAEIDNRQKRNLIYTPYGQSSL